MKDKKRSKVFLFIVGVIMLVGIIHGCDDNNVSTASTTTTTSNNTTSIDTSTTTSIDEVTSTGSNISLDSEDETTNINSTDELIRFNIYSNENGDVSLQEMTTSGIVPRTIKLNEGFIKTDGSINNIKLTYDLENKTIEVMINDVTIYKNQKAMELDVNAIRIDALDESHGVILLNNLVIANDESTKTKNFYSTTNFEIITLDTPVSAGDDKTLVISFDYAIIQKSPLGTYDKISIIIGVSS